MAMIYTRIAGIVGSRNYKQPDWFFNFISPHLWASDIGHTLENTFPTNPAGPDSAVIKKIRTYIDPGPDGDTIPFLFRMTLYGEPSCICVPLNPPDVVQGEPTWRAGARPYEAMIAQMVADEDFTEQPFGDKDRNEVTNRKVFRAYPSTLCPAELQSSVTWEGTNAGAAYDWGSVALAHAHGFDIKIWQIPDGNSPSDVNDNPVPNWLEPYLLAPNP